MIRPTWRSWSAATASAIARYVLPVPAGPIPKVTVWLRIASTYCFWFTVFGAIRLPRWRQTTSSSASRIALGLVERADHRVDGRRPDVVAALDELDELVHDRARLGDLGLLALDREPVAAQQDRAGEPVAQLVEHRVAHPGELRRDVVRDRENFLHPARSVGGGAAAANPGRMRVRALIAAVVVVALSAAAAGTAAPPEVRSKQAQATRVLAEINGIDAQLGHTVEAWNGANLRLASVDRELRTNTAQLAVARAQYRVAQRRIARRLVAIYVAGEPDMVDVILGASNVGDLIDGLDAVSKVTAQDRQIARQASTLKAKLDAQERRLVRARAEQRATLADLTAKRAQITELARHAPPAPLVDSGPDRAYPERPSAPGRRGSRRRLAPAWRASRPRRPPRRPRRAQPQPHGCGSRP